MARVLIIGWGNTLRGDDGVGHLAAEHLLERCDGRDDVEVLPLLQLTLDLAEPLAKAEHVYFLDAAASGEPGELLRRTVAGADEDPPAPHAVSPATLVALAADLYGAAPVCELITVAGGDFAVGEGLTDPVARALDRLTSLLEEELGLPEAAAETS